MIFFLKCKNAKAQRCSIFSLRLCVFAFLSLVLSCNSKPIATTPHLGFYHWQTNLAISPNEQLYLDSLPVQKLYIKFFDIDWDFNKKTPLPHASLLVNADLPASIEIIPTLFITNRTFQQIQQAAIDDLVDNIQQKLTEQFQQFPNQQIKMIQIDCDWSQSTKDKYFYFLEQFKKVWSVEMALSTTIRLHQVKYFEKTGIPPAQRGLLMFYNMGEVKQYATNNSILDLAIANKYIHRLADYPLPLDLGLPLFQWGVLFRSSKMVQLINQLNITDLEDITRFQSIDAIRWQVIKSTYLNGLYLYEGDIIRVEKVAQKDLQSAIHLLRPFFQGKEFDLVFYHLAEEVLLDFSKKDIAEIKEMMLD